MTTNPHITKNKRNSKPIKLAKSENWKPAKPNRWSDILAAMPRLTTAQVEAVKEILDYHLSWVCCDYPKAEDGVFSVQRDLDALEEK